MQRRTKVFAGVVAVVLVAGAAAGGWLYLQQQEEAEKDRGARAAVQALASGWVASDVTKGLSYDGQSGSFVAADFRTATQGLGGAPVTVRATDVVRDGDTATATLSVTYRLADDATWTYPDPVRTRLVDGSWRIVVPADRSLWQPEARSGAKLTATRTWAPRGEILDRDGNALMVMGTVYDVQIDPNRATEAAVTALEKTLDEKAGSLVAKLRAAKKSGSQAPISVITLRQKDFGPLESTLKPLPGIIYPRRQQPLAVSRTFAQPLLGSYGAVTSEMVKDSDGAYAAGDFAGLSGIQGRYDARLRGTPGVTVTATDLDDRLFEKAPVAGQDVRLTLSAKTQTAAESALATTGAVPSALVAVDVRSGQLLAVANSPGLGLNRALLGQYEPGSTLKVATSYALLSKRLVTPATAVPCPTSTVVNGMRVRNFEGETLGKVTFAEDFAHSCNTAFAELSRKLGDGDVRTAAELLGVGGDWGAGLGVGEVFTGSVPVAKDGAEKAAGAFGQGRTLTSPLSLAVMAGTVARGSFVAPTLVTAPEATPAAKPDAQPDAATLGTLRTLMRQVVTDGTAPVLRSTPGGAVSGKTGTAEHGTKNPPDTWCWFVGWQGDVAFAVLVEEGRSGGTVAAPVAKRFLTALAEG